MPGLGIPTASIRWPTVSSSSTEGDETVVRAVAEELLAQVGNQPAWAAGAKERVERIASMLEFAHRTMGGNESLAAWLWRLLAPAQAPGPDLGPLRAGVRAAVLPTRSVVGEVLAAGATVPQAANPELLVSPSLRSMPSLPTQEAVDVLIERFGVRATRKILEVQQWGKYIECTPALEDITARLDVAARVALEPAPPLNGFMAVPPTRFDGWAVHQLLQREYLRTHPANIVVVDRVVYVSGSRIGTLGEVARGDASTGRPELDRRLELLHHALSFVPRSFERHDVTDMTERRLYEIKPRASLSWGVVQLWSYQAGYNAAAQELPVLGRGPAYKRRPTRYRAGHCDHPELLVEGMWRPDRTWFELPPRRMVRVFSIPELPGFLAYDLYVKTNRSEDDAEVLIRLLQLLAALGIRPPGSSQSQQPDQPEQPTFPEQERPAAREASSWRETAAMICLVVAVVLTAGLLAYLVWLVLLPAAALAAVLLALLVGT